MQKSQDKKQKNRIIVVGAGIGGLTAGALLARRGYDVLILDQAIAPGGCASTFKRREFTFDVGATQVAGLESGGIHKRIFDELEIELPAATPCDPACAVFLPGETQPINVWRDPKKWQIERQKQFPGSEPFWQLMSTLFRASWRFQSRDPVLPPRNLWDLWQLISALRLDTFITVPFTFMTVGDALRSYRIYQDKRLRTFLDLQLKLYSQVDADETALLYAATALGVSQEPQGLSHLQGSMQVLSDRLVEGLEKYGGKLLMRHTVEKIHTNSGKITGVSIRNQKNNEVWFEPADKVVANVTVHNLVKLLDINSHVEKSSQNSLQKKQSWLQQLTTKLLFPGYKRRVDKLPSPSGAFVIYLGVEASAIPENCPPHLQFFYDYDGEIGENNSLFVSVSKPGDGRAPAGKATIIASSFTDTRKWWHGTEKDYQHLKQEYTEKAIARLSEYFHLTPETIIHSEAATPRTFAHFTAREDGFVGGIGQRIPTFGPFGFATRTPIANLWLVGDSTHPGEGTAGVSYSALTVVRQIQAEK
ncbi:MAG: NAD(P)-binding protein [Oscillatoria sp. PMC 1068.18]|nr:NAD(P)-binding protein [Oscillatoria sp. PMC 1076.18]MEC4990145.1 NAD(P)-binding protein [Oscillatoria sp. PMC 1068.18]